MVFNLKRSNVDYINDLYDELMVELEEWYQFNWNQNVPQLYVIDDKETFESVKGGKYLEHVRGFGDYCNNFYVYSPTAMEKYTIHKYDKESYRMFLKHELDHRFFYIFTKGARKPKWLVEGNAGYVAGQYKLSDKVEKFHKFLEMIDNMKSSAYGESGFAVKLLIEKVGKDKYLKFLKDLSKKDFKREFEDTFGLNLEYDSFNRFLNSSLE
jgi:hypothetical protein